MLQRAELLPPQASKRCAFESPVSAWWRHGGRMLNKLFDAPRFSRGAGPRTAPRRAGSLRKNHFLPVRGWPPPEPTLENFRTSRCGVFFPGIRNSRDPEIAAAVASGAPFRIRARGIPRRRGGFRDPAPGNPGLGISEIGTQTRGKCPGRARRRAPFPSYYRTLRFPRHLPFPGRRECNGSEPPAGLR